MISGILANNHFWEGLKWTIIAVVWAFMAVGIYRENLWLKRAQQGQLQPDALFSLLRMQHVRNVQMGLLVCFLIIMGIADEFRAPEAMPETLAAPAIITQASPPVAETVPDVLSFEKSTTNAKNTSLLPYGDITEFNEKDSKEQAYLDWLKERYEAWFITYYYLQKCGHADAKDLGLIQNTLALKLAQVHADASVAPNILLAAKGSYDEMYRNVACDGAHLNATLATYDDTMRQLSAPAAADSAQAIGQQPAR